MAMELKVIGRELVIGIVPKRGRFDTAERGVHRARPAPRRPPPRAIMRVRRGEAGDAERPAHEPREVVREPLVADDVHLRNQKKKHARSSAAASGDEH